MKFKKRLSNRKWSTVTDDQISAVISEIAPRYEVESVTFWSDSPDGVVRPDNRLFFFIVSTRSMGYSDTNSFRDEIMTALDRGAYFYGRQIWTKKSDIENAHAVAAYVKRHHAAGPDEE